MRSLSLFRYKTMLNLLLCAFIVQGCDSQTAGNKAKQELRAKAIPVSGTIRVDQQLIHAQTRNIVTVADSGSSGKSLLQGARVVADQKNGAVQEETVTDDKGSFSFQLPPGDYLISGAFTDEFDLAAFAVSTVTDTRSQTYTLELDLNGIVYGKAEDDTGRGVLAKAEIRNIRRFALSVSDGSFTFPSLPAGRHTINLITAQGAIATTEVTVSPGGRADAGVLTLTSLQTESKSIGTLNLHVTDAEGYPLQGATCTLLGQASWGTSQDNGALALATFAYPIEVYCSKAGFVQNKSFITSAETTSEVVRLYPTTRNTGVVSLQVVDSSLVPVPGAAVDLYTDLGIIKSLLTDAEGLISVNASGCVGANVYKSGFQTPPTFQICPPNNGQGESFYQIRLCTGSDCGETVDLCSLASKDCAPPTTTLTTFPPAVTTDRNATFVFASDEKANFHCRFNAGDWEDCTSPMIYQNLDTGMDYIFRVYAIDEAGNRESKDVLYNWTVRKDGILYILMENSTVTTGFFETLSGEGYWAPPTWQTADYVDSGIGVWIVKQDKKAYNDNYELIFNFGDVGGIQDHWLVGGNAEIVEKAWFRVEYADGTSQETRVDCSFMDYTDNFRALGRLYKQYNGELIVEPRGDPTSYNIGYKDCTDPW